MIADTETAAGEKLLAGRGPYLHCPTVCLDYFCVLISFTTPANSRTLAPSVAEPAS